MTYEIFLEPDVHDARTRMPGRFRQRFRRIISSLATEPRPADSQLMDVSGIDVPLGVEVRRVRVDPWRLVFAVNDSELWVWVLALRQRPPYDYADLAELVRKIQG